MGLCLGLSLVLTNITANAMFSTSCSPNLSTLTLVLATACANRSISHDAMVSARVRVMVDSYNQATDTIVRGLKHSTSETL